MDRPTISSALDRAEAEFADREALIDGSVRWTFTDLAEQVRRCAAAMIATGIRPGDRVAVWAPNGHRFVVAALGAVTAGGVLVPVNTRYKGQEAHWILSRSGARLLVVDNGFLGNDYLGMLAAAGRHPQGLTDVIRLDDGGGVGWAQFLVRGNTVPEDEVRARAAAIGPDDVADMFFTSGTTGRPKGVLATHGQDIRVFRAWIVGVGLRHDDRYLILNPMFHTFGYKAGVLACLLQGVTMILQAVFDVPETIQLISKERVTVLPGPPTLYSSVLDHPARSRAHLQSLRLAVTGAAVVPVALVERMRAELFPNVVIAYGLTECCGTATIGDATADAETLARTVGRAIEGTEVIVAGPDGNELPRGEPGEVLVRGYNVMRGYFDDPAATTAAIDDRGFLHTGDIGVMDPFGNLRITDRLKDMFVVGGFNAYPAEVEQIITGLDGVSEVAVVGVPDARLGEVGRAYVLLRPGASLTEDDVIAHCRERLANFKVPRSVRFVDALPRNAGGKVVKYELRQLALAESA
jgi:acyl-CoA synthetase (AMP-forming)/AMP-acid ligase II